MSAVISALYGIDELVFLTSLCFSLVNKPSQRVVKNQPRI